MTVLIVLFNLKPGQTVADYEAWAKATDLPVVRGLKSVAAYEIFRTTALLGSDARPPYQYVEVIQVKDIDGFGDDIASATMQKVAAEFQALADNPIFMLTHSIEQG